MSKVHTCGSKGLNGKVLSLLHACGFTTLNNWDAFAGMYPVGRYGVAIQVSHALHLVHFTVQLHLMRFHDLLHGCPDVAQAHIDACFPDSCIKRIQRSHEFVRPFSCCSCSACLPCPITVSVSVTGHTCVCRLPDGLEKWIIARVKRHRKSTVNDPSIDLRSKICRQCTSSGYIWHRKHQSKVAK